MLQKPVFALAGCQPMSVNTLLCDTLGLADNDSGWDGVARCYHGKPPKAQTAI